MRAVIAKLPPTRHWTAERLCRAIRAFVSEELAERALLDKVPPMRGDGRLMVLLVASLTPASASA